MREGDGGFCGGGEREEGLGSGELGFDFGEADAVVGESKETVCAGCLDKLGRDLLDARGEVVEGDFGDGAVGVFGGHCDGCVELYR